MPPPSYIPVHAVQQQPNLLANAGQYHGSVAPVQLTNQGIQDARHATGAGRELEPTGRFIQIEADIKFGSRKDALFGTIVKTLHESISMTGTVEIHSLPVRFYAHPSAHSLSSYQGVS